MAKRKTKPKAEEDALLNPEQALVVQHAHGPLRVIAVAGSGKTATIIERAVYLVQHGIAAPQDLLLISFSVNARKVMERRLHERLPYVDASKICRTFHSIGLDIFRNEAGDGGSWRIDETGRLYTRALTMAMRRVGIEDARSDKGKDLNLPLAKAFAARCKTDMLVTPPALRRLGNIEPEMRALAEAMVATVGVTMEPDDLITVFHQAEDLRESGAIDDNGTPTKFVTFDDMVYGAAMLLRKPDVKARWAARWKFVMQDECFVSHTPVLLANGKTMTIKEIVDTRWAGELLTWSPETGTVRRRVTGWMKKPTSKPLVRLIVQDCFRFPRRPSARRRFLVCTEDHPVWTAGRGWVAAGKLLPSDIVQVETLAPVVMAHTNRSKIGVRGKRKLKRLMTHKNTIGVCGSSRNGGLPRVRGGNGRGVTDAEAALLERLGPGWRAHCVVRTGLRTGTTSYPNHYKIDIANTGAKLAIELNGRSHESHERRSQDAKKDRWLTRHGWRVLRLTNRESYALPTSEILGRLGCHDGANCPAPASVVLVEPWAPREPWVYDITVEGTHAFYADGVLVHNCQDESTVQAEIAEALCTGHRNYMAVGDPSQAVYGFRGARPDRIMNFDETWPNSKTITMHRNYRSGIEIVEAANRLMKFMPKGTVLPFEMYSERQTRAHVSCHVFGPPDEESAAIAKNVVAHKKAGLDWKDQAILIRMNWMSRGPEIALARADVPYRLISGTSFFSLREVAVLYGYLRLADGRGTARDIEAALLNPNKMLGRAFVEKVMSCYDQRQQGGEAKPDWIDCAMECQVYLAPRQRAALEFWAEIVRGLRVGLSRFTPYQVLTRLKEMAKLDDWVANGGDVGEDNQSAANLEEAMKFAASHTTATSLLDEIDRIEAHRAKNAHARNVVVISTVHKSKGLEFPVVYVPLCEDGIFPVRRSDPRGRPIDDIPEERRLFYVATTRARDELWFSYSRERREEQDATPSVFLKEAEIVMRPGSEFEPGRVIEPVKVGTQMELI